jgi:hypothetical protein
MAKIVRRRVHVIGLYGSSWVPRDLILRANTLLPPFSSRLVCGELPRLRRTCGTRFRSAHHCSHRPVHCELARAGVVLNCRGLNQRRQEFRRPRLVVIDQAVWRVRRARTDSPLWSKGDFVGPAANWRHSLHRAQAFLGLRSTRHSAGPRRSSRAQFPFQLPRIQISSRQLEFAIRPSRAPNGCVEVRRDRNLAASRHPIVTKISILPDI